MLKLVNSQVRISLKASKTLSVWERLEQLRRMAPSSGLKLEACSLGKKVRFFRMSDLAAELTEKHRTGNLAKMLKQLQGLDLLIFDEVGYIPCDRLSSQLLFNVISNSYEQQSIVVTSNLQF